MALPPVRPNAARPAPDRLERLGERHAARIAPNLLQICGRLSGSVSGFADQRCKVLCTYCRCWMHPCMSRQLSARAPQSPLSRLGRFPAPPRRLASRRGRPRPSMRLHTPELGNAAIFPPATPANPLKFDRAMFPRTEFCPSNRCSCSHCHGPACRHCRAFARSGARHDLLEILEERYGRRSTVHRLVRAPKIVEVHPGTDAGPRLAAIRRRLSDALLRT